MAHVWLNKPYGPHCRWCGRSLDEFKDMNEKDREGDETYCKKLRERIKKMGRTERQEKNKQRRENPQPNLPFNQKTGKRGK